MVMVSEPALAPTSVPVMAISYHCPEVMGVGSPAARAQLLPADVAEHDCMLSVNEYGALAWSDAAKLAPVLSVSTHIT